jgi:hypothetical protein
MALLTTDLSREAERPYFLWDENRTVGEFRRALATADAAERRRLVGKLMREARDRTRFRAMSTARPLRPTRASWRSASDGSPCP